MRFKQTVASIGGKAGGMLGGVKAVSLPTGKVGRLSFPRKTNTSGANPSSKPLSRIVTRIRFNRAGKARKEAFGALFGVDDAASVLEAHLKIIIQFPVLLRPESR